MLFSHGQATLLPNRQEDCNACKHNADDPVPSENAEIMKGLAVKIYAIPGYSSKSRNG